ncbi:MAG: alpha/beta hydrolase [Saprospiraceae bacterium]|nr:alpha/beta hydrolase [Saprospiraceae bacterium]
MIKKTSYFKNPEQDKESFQNWVTRLEQHNGYSYDKLSIQTSLGTTQVYGFNTGNKDLETLLIFPGFRTSTLIWDLDRGLQSLAKKFRIFMVETNGQPNLSDGNSPSVKSLDYGKWGNEIFEQLGIESAYIAGASFGGLVCMKIALVIPQKIKASFLLNPGCFRLISLHPITLYYTLLPSISPKRKSILKFLDEVVFCKPNHQLSPQAETLLLDYLELAIKQYKDKTEKPYYMGKQLDNIKVKVHLLVGDADPLIPYQKSVSRARKHIKKELLHVEVFKDVGHGNECYAPCLEYVEKVMLGG